MVRRKVSVVSSSRKRTNEESPPLSNEPKKRRVHEKKDNYEEELSKKDTHCWICHSNELTDDMWYFWPCCPRIYHFSCMDDYPTSEAETACPECQLESIDGTMLSKPIPRLKLNELLMSVAQKYLDDKKGRKSNDKKKGKKKFELLQVFVKWPANAEAGLIKVVDFNYLINKIHSDAYSKTSTFFSDVKWILHNCHLLYGSQSAVTNDAQKLVQLIKADLLDVEACYECCYLGSKNPDFFMKPCNPPHQIIWAQFGKSPFWAAKCLKVNQETVYVKFFGKHEIGKIPVSKCYFISRNHPNYPRIPKTKCYNDSMVELKRYIELFELQRRETFKYYHDKTVFKPENAGKENQEINLNLMGETTPPQDYSSSPIFISHNLASDDLRLGADFSNLNHPGFSGDQMSSIGRPVIADGTRTTSSSNSTSLPYNIESPVFINQYNLPHVEEVSSSEETMEERSNQLVSSRISLQDQINVINRFFTNGSIQPYLREEQLKRLLNASAVFLKKIIEMRGFSMRQILQNPQREELQNQILKQRTQFNAEKKELMEKISEFESEIMELKDKLQNTQMILRSMTANSSVEIKNKEDECQKILQDKEKLLEKLKLVEAENIALKEELEGDPYVEAKRKLFCYVCVKPANIICCTNACYCSEKCQDNDEKHVCQNPTNPSCLEERRRTKQSMVTRKTIEVMKEVTLSEEIGKQSVERSLRSVMPRSPTKLNATQVPPKKRGMLRNNAERFGKI